MCSMDFHAREPSLFTGRGRDPEALHDVLDFSKREFNRLPELPAWQAQCYRGWRTGMGIHDLGRLPAGMTQLRPEMIALAGRRLSPAGQRGLQPCIRFTVDDDVTRPLQVVTVNLDISTQQQTRAAIAPEAIESFQLGRGYAFWRGQTFRHGGLGKTVWQNRTAGKIEGLGEHSDILDGLPDHLLTVACSVSFSIAFSVHSSQIYNEFCDRNTVQIQSSFIRQSEHGMVKE